MTKPESNLFKGINKGEIKLVEQSIKGGFLKKPVDINTKNEDGKTALMIAIDRRQPEIVKLLIEKGADLNVQDKHGNTALTFTILNIAQSNMAELLIEKGADVDLQDKDGITPLMKTLIFSSDEAIKKLDDLGYNRIELNPKLKANAELSASLQELAKRVGIAESEKIARILIEKGADLNIQDNSGRTALMLAIALNKKEIAKNLIMEGADINIKDNAGITALKQALDKQQSEIAKILIENGAK
jgi:uncharacterized protein